MARGRRGLNHVELFVSPDSQRLCWSGGAGVALPGGTCCSSCLRLSRPCIESNSAIQKSNLG